MYSDLAYDLSRNFASVIPGPRVPPHLLLTAGESFDLDNLDTADPAAVAAPGKPPQEEAALLRRLRSSSTPRRRAMKKRRVDKF